MEESETNNCVTYKETVDNVRSPRRRRRSVLFIFSGAIHLTLTRKSKIKKKDHEDNKKRREQRVKQMNEERKKKEKRLESDRRKLWKDANEHGKSLSVPT